MFHQNDVQDQLHSSKIQEKGYRVKPVLLLLHLPCLSTLSWYFVAPLGKKKRKVSCRKDWQNGSVKYEFPVPESLFKIWLHTLHPCTSASMMQDICWQKLQQESHGGASMCWLWAVTSVVAAVSLSLQTRCAACWWQ